MLTHGTRASRAALVAMAGSRGIRVDYPTLTGFFGGNQTHTMSRIFITGSADGLGRMAAQLLVAAGHEVVLHARNAARVADALANVNGASDAIAGDLANLRECRAIAERANALGPFDAVIHNAAIGYQESRRTLTEDGLPRVFAINALAPYVLTALMHKPQRLVYLSSGMHEGADPGLDDLAWAHREWNGSRAYAQSKLHDTILAFAVARLWPHVKSNAVTPGWVATKMGGTGAPDDLAAAPKTQVWLATSNDRTALVSGRYFYHMRQRAADPAARDRDVQQRLLAECARLSGIELPSATGG